MMQGLKTWWLGTEEHVVISGKDQDGLPQVERLTMRTFGFRDRLFRRKWVSEKRWRTQ